LQLYLHTVDYHQVDEDEHDEEIEHYEDEEDELVEIDE